MIVSLCLWYREMVFTRTQSLFFYLVPNFFYLIPYFFLGSGQFGSMLLHDKDSKKSEETFKLWGSCRLVYTICAFFCTINLILMRFNISFAMVCMVSHPLPNETYADDGTILHSMSNMSRPHSMIPEGCEPEGIDEQTIREDRVKRR